MNKREATFDVSVPVERVWKAFTEETEKLTAPPENRRSETRQLKRELKLLEAVPHERLRWEQIGPELPERAEFTVVFESTETGSRFTVTRAGFGEGELAEIFGDAHWLGTSEGMMDLVLYLETGNLVKRHYDGCTFSSTGLIYIERSWGLEVRGVKRDTFGEQARMQIGDRLLSLGGTQVYKRADMWALASTHRPGTELEIDFIRDQTRMQATGKLSAAADRAIGE